MCRVWPPRRDESERAVCGAVLSHTRTAGQTEPQAAREATQKGSGSPQTHGDVQSLWAPVRQAAGSTRRGGQDVWEDWPRERARRGGPPARRLLVGSPALRCPVTLLSLTPAVRGTDGDVQLAEPGEATAGRVGAGLMEGLHGDVASTQTRVDTCSGVPTRTARSLIDSK